MKNKVFISGLLVLCLGIAAVYHTHMWAQTEDVAAEEAEVQEIEKVEKTRLSDIPFDEMAAILDDNAIKFVLEGMKLGALVDSVKSLSMLFKALVKFEQDAVKAQKARARFVDTAICSQMKKGARQAARCQAVKCSAGRSACLRQGIRAMKIMLAPLLVDGFIGYQQKDGKHVEGLALMTFDVAQQGGVKAQFNKDVVEPLKKVMKVLDVLEKSIQPKSKILANQGL